MENPIPASRIHYLAGGGELGGLIRDYDWGSSSLGPIDQWPVTLLTTLNIILNSKFPMFLWWGKDLIQFYNDAYLPSLGENGKHPKALGQKGEDCWTETWPVIEPLIDQVMNHGQPVWSENQLIPIYRNNRLEDVYWTFGYSRVNDENGLFGGILAICYETTVQVENLKAIQHQYQQQTQRNETLATTNQELTDANDELVQEQETIQIKLSLLAEKEERFKNIINQGPVAVAIFRGPKFIIEEFNYKVLEYWGRTAEQVKDIPLFEALPEARGQGFEELLTNVLLTGERFVASELPVTLFRKGKLGTTWINFIYDPIRDAQGNIDGITVICNEITEQVNARKEVERSFQQGRLSKEAAQLGIFDCDIENNIFEMDDRCRVLFGVTHSGQVTYEQDFLGSIYSEDHHKVSVVLKEAFDESVSDGDYDVEYRTMKPDKKVRWIRSKGKVYFDDQETAIRFIGSVLDITEQKTDELRKNDFIGMVSHEMKTPLTSLNGFLQILHGRAGKAQEAFNIGLLSKAIYQVKKVTNLINGFLNVSQLESGKIQIQKKPFVLQELIEELIEDLRLAQTTHTITFYTQDLVTIKADRQKIENVISNLLSNAIKYSPQGKHVEVRCTLSEGRALVSVKDEGMGIKPENISRLFDRFYRVEDNNQISGFGIGLYLCAEIIERHNGKIWAESTPGLGSTFYFSLPLN